jgi:hypothetical protein
MKRLLLALCLLPSLVWATTPYQTLVAASSPCTYWYMDAPSGTTETNHGSATGQDGTYVNTPTLGATGIPGGGGDAAVTFLAASTQYMSWPGTGGGACPITSTRTATCNSGTPINATIVLWFKATAANNPVVFGIGGPSHYTFALIVDSDSSTSAVMWQDGGGTYLQPNDSSVICTVGTWCMPAFKFTASGTTAKMYPNGSPGASANTPSGSCGGQQPTGLPSVGRLSGGSNYTSGTIDEVAWFDQALADATILAFYTAGIASPATGGLGNYSVKRPQLPNFRDDDYFTKMVRYGYHTGQFAARTMRPLEIGFFAPFTVVPDGHGN